MKRITVRQRGATFGALRIQHTRLGRRRKQTGEVDGRRCIIVRAKAKNRLRSSGDPIRGAGSLPSGGLQVVPGASLDLALRAVAERWRMYRLEETRWCGATTLPITTRVT